MIFMSGQKCKIWISQLMDNMPFGPFLSSVVIFGLPVDIVFSVFVLSRRGYIAQTLYPGLLLSLVWLNLGAYFIWLYENRVIPGFLHRAEDLVEDTDALGGIIDLCSCLFSNRFLLFSLPWTILLVVTWMQVRNDTMLMYLGIKSYSDVWYKIGFIAMAWTGTITGIGF